MAKISAGGAHEVAHLDASRAGPGGTTTRRWAYCSDGRVLVRTLRDNGRPSREGYKRDLRLDRKAAADVAAGGPAAVRALLEARARRLDYAPDGRPAGVDAALGAELDARFRARACRCGYRADSPADLNEHVAAMGRVFDGSDHG